MAKYEKYSLAIGRKDWMRIEAFNQKGLYTKEEIQAIAQNATTFSQTDCLWAFPQYVQIMGRKHENISSL